MNEQTQNPFLLEVADLRKSYMMGAVTIDVLKGVSLRVEQGESLSIMGASGAGKSTLLHVLGGLDRPTSGCVRFRGRDIYALSARRRTEMRAMEVGFVFQAYHLLPELDLLENVMLPSMSRRGSVRAAARNRRRASELIDQVGLSARARHLPTELSGGEQQRAALARALMNDPDLVLADEPTGNLDSATGNQVLDHLFELVRDRGRTLVLVTHNRDVAGRCGRTLVLQDGVMASRVKEL